MNDVNITKLENQTHELLDLCQRLNNENTDLRVQLRNLNCERSGLIEAKEKVRTQVEGMITRLRSMENA